MSDFSVELGSAFAIKAKETKDGQQADKLVPLSWASDPVNVVDVSNTSDDTAVVFVKAKALGTGVQVIATEIGNPSATKTWTVDVTASSNAIQ